MKILKKADRPSKVCPICNRPFTWRKKWARVWDWVLYCSAACSREAKAIRAASN